MGRYWGEIKDPVHGYIYITEDEKEVIDSFPVQRLRRIRQLGGAELVYPGANHTRFEHSIGVMYLARRLMENPNLSQYITEEESQKIRIAALLHDVGHGPFSHVFDHLLSKFLNKTHEDITTWIIQESELKDLISDVGSDPNEVGKLAVGLLHKPGKAFMDQIIRSGIDVDKLDFIVRDTYHTGAKYGYIDIFRLIQMLDVLDGNLAVDLGALSALESFIIARIECFKSIYFHRVARAVQIMIAMAMEKAKDELGLIEFQSPEEYLEMDDYTTWAMLKQCEKSKKIIRDLERRKLIKCAYSQIFYVRDKEASQIFDIYKIREQIKDRIASKAGVESQSVVIDVPTLPSVPTSPSILLEPMEIPLFYKTRAGTKVPQRLNDISGIFDVLKGFMLRIYTEEKNLERVGLAAENVLRGDASSAKISY